jgi:16S rRNA (uracil1498-N3)-methyltransferase
MRLTRIYVEHALLPGSRLEMPAQTASHLAKVLRVRNGDELVLFNGDGHESRGSVETVRGSRVSVLVGNAVVAERESPCSLTLVQCVPRGDRMDFIVQKATELGVARIVPVLSQRSVVRLDAAQAESKTAHWRAVAVSACEQCGRNRLPAIEPAVPLLTYLGNSSTASIRLVLEPESSAAAVPKDVGSGVDVAIGPEGGFAAEELEAFRIAGFTRLQLGPRILRTETAAIAALTWLQTHFGDMQP